MNVDPNNLVFFSSDDLFSHSYFSTTWFIPHWIYPMDIPVRCLRFLNVRTAQRLYSMVSIINSGQSAPPKTDCEEDQTPNPMYKQEPEPEQKDQDSPLIIKPQKKDVVPSVSLIVPRLKPREMPHCFILLNQGFWFPKKPHILLLDEAKSILYLNDLKKQKQFLINNDTTVIRSGKSYKITFSNNN